MSSGLEQVRECRHHIDLAAIFGETAQAGLLKAELLLDHPERMLNLGADVSFGCLDQILQLALRGLSGKKSARNAALSISASLLRMDVHGLRDRMLIVIER